MLAFRVRRGFPSCRNKNSFLCLFAHDSMQTTQEAPLNMLIAMGISSFLCIFLGCNPQWLYEMLPNGGMGYHPYDATHVITQLEILLFSALAFTLLNLWGKYHLELPSVNLDVDWIYRKAGRGFMHEYLLESIKTRTCSSDLYQGIGA